MIGSFVSFGASSIAWIMCNEVITELVLPLYCGFGPNLQVDILNQCLYNFNGI
uniref:Uncharacterized protein n=1 Tax=Manihot esculenta TaxID=3983 RepID=A0A2C9UR05_MANES